MTNISSSILNSLQSEIQQSVKSTTFNAIPSSPKQLIKTSEINSSIVESNDEENQNSEKNNTADAETFKKSLLDKKIVTPSHQSDQEQPTERSAKKITLKNLNKKNRQALMQSIKDEIADEMKNEIASKKNDEFKILFFENEEFSIKYTIRFFHFYCRFVIYSNAESVNLNPMLEKSIESKTNTNVMKV